MRKTFLIFTLLLFIFLIPSSTFANNIQDIDNIKDEILEINMQLQNIEAKEKEVMDSIDILDIRILKIEGEISYLSRQIVNINKKIETINFEIEYISTKKEIMEEPFGFFSFLRNVKTILLEDIKIVRREIMLEETALYLDILIDMHEETILIKDDIEQQKIEQILILSEIREEYQIQQNLLSQKKEEIEDIRKIVREIEEAQLRDDLGTPIGEILFPVPSRGVSSITSWFGNRICPITGKKDSFHRGIDVAAPTGTPVQAVADGIAYSHSGSSYGNYVIVVHSKSISTLYAHNSKNLVGNGEHVSAGQIIAYVGNTGVSTGSHVHFEVRIDGNLINPMNYY